MKRLTSLLIAAVTTVMVAPNPALGHVSFWWDSVHTSKEADDSTVGPDGKAKLQTRAGGPQQPLTSGPFPLVLDAGKSGSSTSGGLKVVEQLAGTEAVSYENVSLYIGAAKFHAIAEPTVLVAEAGERMRIISWHTRQATTSAPSGRLLEIAPNASEPVRLFPAGGGILKPDHVLKGFGIDGDLRLNWLGQHRFQGCRTEKMEEDVWQVFWLGDGNPDGYECTGELWLGQDKQACSLGWSW
ncbi:MAG: hypothetical protein M1825_001717 [Sarcosagium campestre]|nr:MAG: hypothetical protein M1825_001717 [Sarcosagium campestre]